MEKERKSLFKSGKHILFAGGAIILVAIICGIIFAPSGEVEYDVKTTLKECLESSDLNTAEYTYNSIAKVKKDATKKDSEDNVKYYVLYEGKVKSGFNINDIDIRETDNGVTLIIPQIVINSVEVDTDLEQIFTKKKYDTEKTYAEAYAACCEDLESKAKANLTLYRTAVESAKETLTAFVKPFEKQLGENKKIEVEYINESVLEGK